MQSIEDLYRFIAERTGIQLGRGGIQKALNHYVDARMNELGLPSIGAYLEWLGRTVEEFERLIEIITVPHTWFFRDPVQLGAIASSLRLMAREGRTLRLWIPACATGEDAYSLSLIVERLGLRADILATDISRRSIALAQAGRYTAWSLRELPSEHRCLFASDEKGGWRLEERIRQRVRFQVHNLMEPTPKTPGGWDLVLCRNVLIYFAASTGTVCAERIGASLNPLGQVFFGAGELIHNPPATLKPVQVEQRIAFQRKDSPLPGRDVLGVRAGVRIPVTSAGGRQEEQAQQKTSLPGARTQVRGVERRPAPSSLPQKEAPPATGHDLLDARDSERAAVRYLAMAAEHPTSASYRMYAGMALYTCRDFERAHHELRAALLLDDGLWPAALYAALCLDNLGIPHQADAEYRHTVRLLEGSSREVEIPESIRTMTRDLLELAKRRASRGGPAPRLR